MDSPIVGLHHVTATVDDAQRDLDFAAGALGLRLVKKTVNFDNHHVYHFYYGDERGTPGTIWTTFPYRGHGVRVGTKGAGQITAVTFSVPSASLPFWKSRFDERGIPSEFGDVRFGDDTLVATDPSGLVVELAATGHDDRAPWKASLDPARAVRGLYSVTMTVRAAAPTIEFMTQFLGFAVVAREGRRTRLAVNGDAAGHRIDVVDAPDAPQAVNGLGTVHHVAMAVRTPDEQLRMRAALVQAGRQVTEVRDRQYFTSIYFREPGGVLFEIATIPPGFLVDEPLADLGRSLKLPPWEEPNRADIESALPPIVQP